MVFVKIWLNNVYYINYSPIYLFLKLWPLLLGGSSSPSASSSISMTFRPPWGGCRSCSICISAADIARLMWMRHWKLAFLNSILVPTQQGQDYYDQCRHRNIVSLVGYKKKIHVDNISKHITTSCNVGFHISIHNISKRYLRDVYFITF